MKHIWCKRRGVETWVIGRGRQTGRQERDTRREGRERNTGKDKETHGDRERALGYLGVLLSTAHLAHLAEAEQPSGIACILTP